MGALHHDDFTEQMFKLVPEGMYLRTNGVRHSDDGTEREYHFYERKTHKQWISFRARRLPGCCGVLVLYYLRPDKDLDAKKQRVLFLEVLSMVVLGAGFAKLGTVLMTQTVDSAGDRALVSAGFKPIMPFVNWKTGNSISCWSFVTTKPPAPPKSAPKFDDEYGDY